MTTAEYNPFEVAQAQFDNVANQLQLAGEVRQILRWPLREFRFQISVKMDDGSNGSSSASACSTTMRAGRARAASASTPTRHSIRCALWECG